MRNLAQLSTLTHFSRLLYQGQMNPWIASIARNGKWEGQLSFVKHSNRRILDGIPKVGHCGAFVSTNQRLLVATNRLGIIEKRWPARGRISFTWSWCELRTSKMEAGQHHLIARLERAFLSPKKKTQPNFLRQRPLQLTTVSLNTAHTGTDYSSIALAIIISRDSRIIMDGAVIY